VTLFTGCVANIFDIQTHNATIKLLTRLGYDTHIQADQTCCGAIHAHNGEMERAKACARKNLDAIKHGPSSTVVFNSSGCGAFLQEYGALLGDNADSDETRHALPASDIMDFLLATGRLDELTFRPLEARVAVHEPCSQRNVLKNHGVIYSLLSRIPGLDVVSLSNNMCCGAGGTRMLTHPQIAVPLRDDKVKALEESQAELLISTNLTCALHLSSGIRSAGKQIEVMHPVRLLAQQLADG
jgi:glycolate oxidase iron-sulfur subunit